MPLKICIYQWRNRQRTTIEMNAARKIYTVDVCLLLFWCLFVFLFKFYVRSLSSSLAFAYIDVHARILIRTHSSNSMALKWWKPTNAYLVPHSMPQYIPCKRHSIERMMSTLGAVLYALFYLISIQFNFLFVCFFVFSCVSYACARQTYTRRKHEGMSDFLI